MDARREFCPAHYVSPAGVLGEMVAQWCWGYVREVVCTLESIAGWHLGRACGSAAPRMEEKQPCHPSAVQPRPAPAPTASPVTPAGLYLQPALDPGKNWTACFCLTARELQAAETRGGGGRGGRPPPHQDGFFCFSACRKSRNRIREAAWLWSNHRAGEGMSGAGCVTEAGCGGRAVRASGSGAGRGHASLGRVEAGAARAAHTGTAHRRPAVFPSFLSPSHPSILPCSSPCFLPSFPLLPAFPSSLLPPSICLTLHPLIYIRSFLFAHISGDLPKSPVWYRTPLMTGSTILASGTSQSVERGSGGLETLERASLSQSGLPGGGRDLKSALEKVRLCSRGMAS